VAPDGFHVLEKSTSYHFLRSDSKHERVLLMHFHVEGNKPRASLKVVNKRFFEEALLSGQIAIAEKQAKRPPWIEDLEGMDLFHQDRQRSNPKMLHKYRVNKRYQLVQPLLLRTDEILEAENPDLVINRIARSITPTQNESRMRLWFYTLLCFGCDAWNLMPPFHRIGKWNRHEHSSKKFGRSSPKGAQHGFPCDARMVKLIHESYLKFCGQGRYMNQIYSYAMIETFGCRVRTDSQGKKSYWHVDGNPYPTYDQYYYHVNNQFSRTEVNRILYGDTRVRTRLAASVGKFSASTANLLEKIEADGYYVDETPRGLIEGSPLPPICVVKSVDLASGRSVGIGFAFGRERSTAYGAMLFSMAIGLQRYGELFGLEIDADDGKTTGLPRLPIFDRGPGAKRNLTNDYESVFPIREITPSYSGQSKATVESKHPRTVQIEGAPNYIRSELNPVQMARREIQRLIRDNQATDMSNRLTPEMQSTGTIPSPNGVWNFLDQRGRTDAQSMTFEDAVRAFLSPIAVSARNDGVYFNEMHFDSKALRETQLIDRVARGQVTSVNGYVLDLCLRHLWLEIEGQIIQVDAQLSLRDDENQLFLSLPEMVALATNKRATRRLFQEHQHAATSEFFLRTEEAIGRKPNAGKRLQGRPKTKTVVARQETAEFAAHTSSIKRLA